MNSLNGLLEQFTLPELSRVLKRSVLVAIGLAVIAFIVALFASSPLAALGVCLGIGLGILNIRLVTSQTARVTTSAPAHPMRSLGAMTIVRLAVLTAVVIGLAIVSVSLGMGTVVGVMIFYFAFIGNLVAVALKHKAA